MQGSYEGMKCCAPAEPVMDVPSIASMEYEMSSVLAEINNALVVLINTVCGYSAEALICEEPKNLLNNVGLNLENAKTINKNLQGLKKYF